MSFGTLQRIFLLAGALGLAISGCGDDDGPSDTDAGVTPDGSTTDGGGTPCTEASECDDGNACNGAETCDGVCVAGTALTDGEACELDGDTGTSDICVQGSCVRARCGDGFTDSSTSEQCDDGNDVSGDGCDACQFSCESDGECDDGNACTGTETCSLTTHACETGTPLNDGDPCASGGECLAGSCVPTSCSGDPDCDDGNPCNGAEVCGTGNTCEAGTPLDCDDTDPCTVDSCDATAADAASACVNDPLDADGDGFGPSSPDACGEDCDDTNPDINPDAPEICGDGVDNNCMDGTNDEAVSDWYADCDADGFAAMGAETMMSCAAPAAVPSACSGSGSWTAREPAGPLSTDCNDGHELVYPGRDREFQTDPISGADPVEDFDYDCNAVEEPQEGDLGRCQKLGMVGCLAIAGWSSEIPECGVEGDFILACDSECAATVDTRKQACR